MRISDWSSDVCSSDLEQGVVSRYLHDKVVADDLLKVSGPFGAFTFTGTDAQSIVLIAGGVGITPMMSVLRYLTDTAWKGDIFFFYGARSTEEFVFRDELERLERRFPRSEEHTSELQSLMRISYAVFCLKNKTQL